jgi:hypothetical protein
VYRAHSASPIRPLYEHRNLTASTPTTSSQPSTPSCDRLPTSEQARPRHTGARASAASLRRATAGPLPDLRQAGRDRETRHWLVWHTRVASNLTDGLER